MLLKCLAIQKYQTLNDFIEALNLENSGYCDSIADIDNEIGGVTDEIDNDSNYD